MNYFYLEMSVLKQWVLYFNKRIFKKNITKSKIMRCSKLQKKIIVGLNYQNQNTKNQWILYDNIDLKNIIYKNLRTKSFASFKITLINV